MSRHIGIDTARGLAIACMVADHVCKLLGPDWAPVRWTVGRLALPLFFVVAGYLYRGLTWRHAAVAGIGLALPLVVPWIDHPNVLVWWAVGCVLLRVVQRWAHGPVVLLVAALTAYANGLPLAGHDSYPAGALVGLLVAGQLLRALVAFGFPDPWVWRNRALAAVGRAPVRWYVGHLLVLQTLYRLVVS